MKLKLTLLLLFLVLGLYAQKQIQPYNFSVSDSYKDKTETIMIYAAASSVNNLTFTLKNAKDEVLLDKEDKEISFQVFPFTEVSFGKHLTDAITSMKENDVENTYEIIKGRIKNLKDNPTSQEQKITVQDIRNIYQFFNALVITAFAYDTEPIAGVLKYSLNTTIAKKNIEGQDANLYFRKNAKHLRKHVIEGAVCKKETDEFIQIVVDSDEYKVLKEFHENTKGPNTYKAKVKFKHYAEKKLKELYNVYQIKGYWQDGFLSNYIFYKKNILSLEEINTNKKTLIDQNIKKIETIDSIAKPYNNLMFERNITSENFNKAKNKETELKIRKDAIESSYNASPTTELDNESKALQNLITVMKDSIKYYERKLADYSKLIPFNQSNAKNEKDSFNAEITKSRDTIKLNEGEIKIIQNYIDNLISENRLKIKKLPLWNFDVETIEIDINDGFIEHITAVGKVKLPVIDENLIRSFGGKKAKDNDDYDRIKEMLEYFYNERIVKEIFNNVIDKELKFENEFPIGFSSKSDFADLHKYTLYAFEGAEKIFSLPVTNVITLYVQRHQNDRLDFSPKDQVVSLPSDDFARSNAVELKKETSSKILNVNIYSDFLGLKEGNPNGLLQFEVEKNIPLWTKRMILGVGRSSNLGIVNYINFNLTWAKIGDENKKLQVKYADRYVNNEYHPNRYVTFLDMIKYENTSVGADLNIASFDFPLLKARIELNAGIHYGRVNVVDTLKNDAGMPLTTLLDKNVNIIRAYPDFILRIRPEERFGAYFRFRPFKTIVPNNEEFYTVSSEKKFVDNQKLTSKWLHRFELGTYYTPSPKGDNKFFFRYRYTNTSDWETNGYGEFQVGYLVYLKF